MGHGLGRDRAVLLRTAYSPTAAAGPLADAARDFPLQGPDGTPAAAAARRPRAALLPPAILLFPAPAPLAASPGALHLVFLFISSVSTSRLFSPLLLAVITLLLSFTPAAASSAALASLSFLFFGFLHLSFFFFLLVFPLFLFLLWFLLCFLFSLGFLLFLRDVFALLTGLLGLLLFVLSPSLLLWNLFGRRFRRRLLSWRRRRGQVLWRSLGWLLRRRLRSYFGLRRRLRLLLWWGRHALALRQDLGGTHSLRLRFGLSLPALVRLPGLGLLLQIGFGLGGGLCLLLGRSDDLRLREHLSLCQLHLHGLRLGKRHGLCLRRSMHLCHLCHLRHVGVCRHGECWQGGRCRCCGRWHHTSHGTWYRGGCSARHGGQWRW